MFECVRSNWEETVKGLGESIYIVWMSFGIVIEKINESVDKLWGEHFWSPSYFLATTGNVTIDTLKAYIENQRVEQE